MKLKAVAMVVFAIGATRDVVAQGAADAQASVRVLSLTVPDSVGPYAQTARRDFGSPTGGIGYTFAASRDSGRVLLTAYVYERDSAQRTLSATDAIANEAALFRQTLDIERARGTVSRYEIPIEGQDSSVVLRSGEAIPGSRMVIVLRRADRTYVSYFSVFAIGNGFIKIRCSVPVEGWERRNVPGLATAIVRRTIDGR